MKTTVLHKAASPYTPLIQGTVALVVLLGLQPFLWNYVYTSTIALQEKRTEVQQLTNLEARLTEVQTRQTNDKQYLDQLSATFPLLGNESQIIDRVEQLGQRAGVGAHIQTITKQPLVSSDKSDKNNTMTSLVLGIQANGSPSQLFYYLDVLEHLPELDSIQSWSIAPITLSLAGAFAPTYTYGLTMSIVFYLQQPS